tara:strand:+ start:29590 stop:31545 length:1956 start_codon:yes stop_codon:yes gene_type:complete
MLRFATAAALALPLAFAAPAVAQAPNVNDLLSDEWRVRNATAVKLIKHPDTRNQDLLRVLQTKWDGHVPQYMGGFGGRFRPTSPRAQTLESAGKEIGYNWPIRAPAHPTTIAELVGPWHPHKLATLVLLQRATPDGLRELEPTNNNLARIWFACCKPNAGRIGTALANATTAEAVLFAYLPQLENRNERLLALIANGSAPARRAALRMVGDLPLGKRQLLGTIEQLLHDDDEAYTRNAAHHLVRSGAAAAELLTKHLGKDWRERQRVLALLCHMDEHATPAAPGLLTCLQYDVTSQRRALVALSNFPVPEALQRRAATEILALLEKTRSRIVRVLATDALAQCGQGVTAEQRTRMQAMLQERRFRTAHSRLIGTLNKLGALPELDLETHVKLATSIYATDDSWVTLADRGEEAGPAIIEHKLFAPAVGTRLAETAPDLLVAWLNGTEPELQNTALAGLLAKRPDLVDNKQLATLLTGPPRSGEMAFDSLCQRPEASEHVAPLLEFASTRGYLSKKQRADIRRLEPSFATLVNTFEDSLRKGQMWSVVRGMDDEKMRLLARQWLKETDDLDVRDNLLAELVKLGLSKGQDIQMVEQALRTNHRNDVLSALSAADKVPAQLIPALEAVCDEEPDGDWWSDDWSAREALITAHR